MFLFTQYKVISEQQAHMIGKYGHCKRNSIKQVNLAFKYSIVLPCGKIFQGVYRDFQQKLPLRMDLTARGHFFCSSIDRRSTINLFHLIAIQGTINHISNYTMALFKRIDFSEII